MQTELDFTHFFNTINLSGTTLLEAQESNLKQEEAILSIIPKGVKVTPLQVHKMYSKIKSVPESSVRRSMTMLTKRGDLEMLDEMVKEKYGKPNHYWIKL